MTQGWITFSARKRKSLLERCKHESFRLKEKRRAGLLNKSASADPG